MKSVKKFTKIWVSFEAKQNVRMKMSDNKVLSVKAVLIFSTLFVTIIKTIMT